MTELMKIRAFNRVCRSSIVIYNVLLGNFFQVILRNVETAFDGSLQMRETIIYLFQIY